MASKTDIVDPTTPHVLEEQINNTRKSGEDVWFTVDGKLYRTSDLLRVLVRSNEDAWRRLEESRMKNAELTRELTSERSKLAECSRTASALRERAETAEAKLKTIKAALGGLTSE